MTCEACGHEMVIGDFPFCPHGRADLGVIPDDVPGGFTVENGFETPQTFYSRKAHRDALAARGLEIHAKWAGPLDKYLTRWDAPSAKILEDAKVLLERGCEARDERRRRAEVMAQFPITVRTLKPEDVGR